MCHSGNIPGKVSSIHDASGHLKDGVWSCATEQSAIFVGPASIGSAPQRIFTYALPPPACRDANFNLKSALFF